MIKSLPLSPPEAIFQRQVVRYAELMGWRCYWTWNSRHSPKGWPDLVLIRRPRVVFAELKAERGRLTDDQAATLAELRACGQEVYLWRPSDWERVERILR